MIPKCSLKQENSLMKERGAVEGWAEEESEGVSMKLKSPQQKVGRVPEMEHILLRSALCNLTLSGPVGKKQLKSRKGWWVEEMGS